MLNVIPNMEMDLLLAPKLLRALVKKTLTDTQVPIAQNNSVAVIQLSGFAAGMLPSWESPAKELNQVRRNLNFHVAVVLIVLHFEGDLLLNIGFST